MSGLLRLAALNGVALVGFAAAAALAGALLHARVSAWAAPLAPARRAQGLLVWAAVPAVLATALAAAAPHVHHWTETFLDHLPH